MPDMLNTAVSGLLTYQRALSTTSHNIANVNTEGYSRQRVEIGTQHPSSLGGLFYGNGAQINAVSRSYDQFLTVEVRDTTSVHSRLEMLAELSGHIDNVLADPVGGISPIMHEFFAAVQDVADDPSSITARYNMINVGNTMTARFHNIDTRFQQLQESTAEDIRTTVEEINTLVSNIRDINIDLNSMSTGEQPTQQSSDLLDRRDQLMNELSEKINISVVNERENNLSIFIGNGQTILTGTDTFTLGTVPNTGDPSQDQIIYNGLNQVSDISASLKSGGELGALLEFRDYILTDTRNDLGRVAIAMADTFNDAHLQGMDLNGNLGTNFFSFDAPSITPNVTNTGTGVISAVVSDATALTRYDYTLEFDGANWTMVSDSGNTSVPVADAAPADTTIVFEGLTVTVDGVASAPIAGDSFRIKPTIEGAASINLLISDPLLIAAGAPIRTGSSLDNLGTAAISPGEVTDMSNANLLNTVTLTFTSATTFTSDSVVTVGATTYAAGAPIPFSNGMTIESNGWQAELSGIPQTNDVLTIEANTGGQGDNRNALNLANLQNTGVLDGGNSNYQEAYSNLVGRVGTQTAAYDTQREATEALKIQARDRRDSKAAVNLDEEAADLIKYQQAYEATARIISTVQTLFDTLIASTR